MPEPAVHLHQTGLVHPVVPELDHGWSMPFHRPQQALGGLSQARGQLDRAPQAARRRQRSHVAKALMREPGDDPAAVAQRERSGGVTRNEALDERPFVGAAARKDDLVERREIVHQADAFRVNDLVAVPDIRFTRLDDAGKPELHGGGARFLERAREPRGRNPYVRLFGEPQRLRLVEGALEHLLAAAREGDADLLPLGALTVEEQSSAFEKRNDDVDALLAGPFAKLGERRDGLRLDSILSDAVARPGAEGPATVAGDEHFVPAAAQ